MKRRLDACRDAAFMHRHQRRKGAEPEPYFNHVIDIAGRVAESPKATETLAVAALLHDVVEDTDGTRDEIAERYGEAVAALVMEVSGDKELPMEIRWGLKVATVASKSDEPSASSWLPRRRSGAGARVRRVGGEGGRRVRRVAAIARRGGVSRSLIWENAMEPWMIGAIAGAVVGWVILLLFGPRGHFEAPNIWVWDREGSFGCLSQILVLLVCAGLGAAGAQIIGS